MRKPFSIEPRPLCMCLRHPIRSNRSNMGVGGSVCVSVCVSFGCRVLNNDKTTQMPEAMALIPLHLLQGVLKRQCECECECEGGGGEAGDDTEGGSASTIKANSMRAETTFKANDKAEQASGDCKEQHQLEL